MAQKHVVVNGHLTLNGVEYVRKDTIRKPAASSKGDKGVCIVIGQRGFVWVGHYYATPDECRIEQAATVRQWGTTKGLGELAMDGPTAKTVLDDCPTVRLHPLAVLATIDCDESKWAGRAGSS